MLRVHARDVKGLMREMLRVYARESNTVKVHAREALPAEELPGRPFRTAVSDEPCAPPWIIPSRRRTPCACVPFIFNQTPHGGAHGSS